MDESRVDAWVSRFRRTGTARTQLLALIAIVFLTSHVGSLLNAVGISHRAARIFFVMSTALAVAIWLFRMRRVNVGNTVTMQYQGWYRVAKLLERDRRKGILLVRLYDEQFTHRPRTVIVSELKNQEDSGRTSCVSISAKEFELCDATVIVDSRLNDSDEKLIDGLPSSARVATVHY
jgi:hypothetical protein